MNQTWYEVLVTYNEETFNYGIWAYSLEEARDKAYFKWNNADNREVIDPQATETTKDIEVQETVQQAMELDVSSMYPTLITQSTPSDSYHIMMNDTDGATYQCHENGNRYVVKVGRMGKCIYNTENYGIGVLLHTIDNLTFQYIGHHK